MVQAIGCGRDACVSDSLPFLLTLFSLLMGEVSSYVRDAWLQGAQGSVVVAHRLSGIFLGSNLCPLHWQADS